MANPKLPIDELRTKCWLREVMRRLGSEDVNELTYLYEAESIRTDRKVPMGYQSLEIRWGDYALGKNRPSQDTLDAVETVFNVSADIYNNGPNNLLLWNALWYQNTLEDLNKLQSIVDLSKELDARIAKIRLDIFLKRSTVNCFLEDLYYSIKTGVSSFDFATRKMADVVDDLDRHLKSKASVEDVLDYFVKDLFFFAEHAFYAGVMESDRTYSSSNIEAAKEELIKEEKLSKLFGDKPSRSIEHNSE